MRADAYNFAALNEADVKSPRFVVAIVYDVDSLYITSHDGIPDVPGTVIQGALSQPTVVSQRLRPDDAAAEIGAASLALVDLAEQFSLEVRERLQDGAGLRGRTVRFYLGYDGLTFPEFVLIGTQFVQGANYSDGVYQISCLDVQRTLRSDLFTLVQTTLAASVTAADSTITLTSTTGLARVAHGASYTDAPLQTVGYIKIKSEIIRYAAIAGNQLTGCVRGIFGTVAAAYTVDPATPADRREKVTEYVYLEMPAVMLAYALLTGKLAGTANTLPPAWHLGIAPELVTYDDFVNIGTGLWNPADDTAGFVVRFEGLAKQDGKRFLEKEIYLLCGLYSPVYADGSLGLRRMARISADAAAVMTLDESNSVQVGELRHDMDGVHNAFVVNWSWNGTEFRRATAYADPQSRLLHGKATTYTLNFKGLYGGRHTDGVIFQMLDMVRDRYAGPPQLLTVQTLHALNRIEVGDVLRVRYANVRDFANRQATGSTSINRAFEVQNVTTDHKSGRVSLELFGSSAEPAVNAPTGAALSLPDAYYTSQGAALGSVGGMTIAGGVLTAASSVLTGSDDLNAPASIYYYDGNLTIGAGVTLRIAANVQLRVRGFLQINGVVDGIGRGRPGVADDGRALAYDVTTAAYESIAGNPGYVGTVRGYDGVRVISSGGGGYIVGRWPPHLTVSRYAVAPRLLLAVAGATMTGLPTDLRGAGGGPGGRIDSVDPIAGRGGAGANGGAGLLIVSRGLAVGVNGFIDLSGANSAATEMVYFFDRYPGAGAGGGPGTLYVLLDGSSFSVPDFSGNAFRARVGVTPVPDANPMDARFNSIYLGSGTFNSTAPRIEQPVMGFNDPDFVTVNGQNLSGSTLVVQHVPAVEVPYDDAVASLPPPVLSITTESIEQGINIYLGLYDFEEFDTVQLYASVDNNRANAVKVGEGMYDTFRVRVADGSARWFWARTRNASGFSAWYPLSAAAGVPGVALGGLRSRGTAETYGTTARKNGGVTAWDSDVYSQETYSGGVYVSFQPATATSSLMVGLNSDPETDASYTSLDYAWRLLPAGTLAIYESGVAVVASAGSYSTLTFLEIKYDGQTVQYFRDGVLARSVPIVGGTFFIDSSFETPGSAIKNIKYGPLTTAPAIPWIARGQCVATATTIKKVGGIAAWDSDCHSFEAYRNGAYVSFVPDQNNAQFMVGLNADPTTDQSYASLDFAWYAHSDGNAYIYESNVSLGSFGAYTSNTVLAIAYDGRIVRYLKDNVLIRERPAPNLTLYLDSSWHTVGASLRRLTFTPYGAATPVPFLSRGNVIVADTTAQKVDGTGAWDSDFISINGYPVCFIEFKPSQTNAALMVGLNSDPFTDQSYTSMDAAWYVQSDGNLGIYQSGVSMGGFGAYTTSTILAIAYSGFSVRYYKDGVEVYSLALVGATLYADASFATVGGAINSLRFGPGTVLSVIDTPQLRPNAATETYSALFAGPALIAEGPFGASTTVLACDSLPAQSSSVCFVTLTFQHWFGNIGGGVGVSYMKLQVLNGAAVPAGYSASRIYQRSDSSSSAILSETITTQFPVDAGNIAHAKLIYTPGGATNPHENMQNVEISMQMIKR